MARIHQSGGLPRFRKSIGKRQACTSPYTYPAEGTTLQAYAPVTLTWDPACLAEIAFVDIYLYDLEEGKSENGPVFAWKDVDSKSGEYDTQIYANWYNATQAGDETMRLQFVAAGDPAWATTLSVGPTFTVSWNGTEPPRSITTNSNFDATSEVTDAKKDSGISGGKLGAAVAIPLLAVILALVGYVFWSRRKSKSSSKRWSGVVQKRMSQMSQAPSFAATHNRGGSNGSYAFSENRNSFAGPGQSPLRNSAFFAPTASRPSGESMREAGAGDRQSRISFATQVSPTKDRSQHRLSRPDKILSFPKVGRNGSYGGSGDILGPLSPEQESPPVLAANNLNPGFRTHHANKSSMNSLLRNEVIVRQENLDEDDSCASALAVIHGKSRLSRVGMEEEQEVIGQAQSGHARQASDAVSMKMPRLDRNSLSPDQALAAYSQNKEALPVTSTKAKTSKLRSFLTPSSSKTSVPSANVTPTLPRDDESQESFMTPSASLSSLAFTPTMLNQPSPAILRPDSTYSTYSQTSAAPNASGLGIHANQDISEDLFFPEANNRDSTLANRSHRTSAASGVAFYAQ